MLPARIPLFSLLGFRIAVDISWFFLAVYLVLSLSTGYFPSALFGLDTVQYVLLGLIGAMGVFLSIILHELAHALVARSFGLPIGGITLFIFGGVAEMRQEPQTPRSEFWVAIAGPFASIAIALVCYVLARSTAIREFVALASFLATANAILALFNLAPAFPLDGGRILRSILWWQTGNLRRATRIAATFGTAFGFLVMLTGFFQLVMGEGHLIAGTWQILIGLFLAMTAAQAKSQTNICQSLEGVSVNELMNKAPLLVSPDVTVDVLVCDYIYHHSRKFVVVTENGEAFGYVSPKEIKQVSQELWPQTYARAIMATFTHDTVASPATDAIEALRKLQSNGVGHLAILEGNTVVGTLTDIDFANYLSVREELTTPKTLSKVC